MELGDTPTADRQWNTGLSENAVAVAECASGVSTASSTQVSM
jgi:hypothetical protein